MPKRPKPAVILMYVCGTEVSSSLIESTHHGLYETASLRRVYPYLNLDELIAFAAASWEIRKTELDSFKAVLDQAESAYDIFQYVYSRPICREFGKEKAEYADVFEWMKKNKTPIPARLKQRHEQLNPFKEKDLSKRLAKVSGGTVEILARELQETVNEYAYRFEYFGKLIERGDNKLVLMTFQSDFPKITKIVPNFIKEVARMLSTYSRDYVLLPSDR